jgi:hypothetical protein
MTAASLDRPEVAEYMAAVRAALADVPAAERDDLIAEVEASLVEAAEETAGPIEARLGPPEQFAAELRHAAGLDRMAAPAARESKLALRLRTLSARIAAHPAVGAARRLGGELAPIWWVARAYLAVGLIAYVLDTAWSTRYPVVPSIGSSEIGLVLITLAVAFSVWAGLQARRHGAPFPRLATVLNLVLLVAAVPVAVEVANAAVQDAPVATAYAPTPVVPGLVSNGVPVDNVYPYSRDGKLLHDVLLYDGAGRPLEIPGNRGLDIDRRFVVTNGNRPLFNAFPIRYYEPGTRQVARPNAAPYVELPLVLTPPLPGTAGD